MSNRIYATIHPQAWQRDNAIDVDPGPTQFDITSQVEKMGRAAALALRDNSYESDELWLRSRLQPFTHHGPFYVECADAIRAHYGLPDQWGEQLEAERAQRRS